MSENLVRSVSFPKDLLRDLDLMAKEQKRPRSRVLADAVRRYYQIWLLDRVQETGRKYGERLGLRSEKDVLRRLER